MVALALSPPLGVGVGDVPHEKSGQSLPDADRSKSTEHSPSATASEEHPAHWQWSTKALHAAVSASVQGKVMGPANSAISSMQFSQAVICSSVAPALFMQVWRASDSVGQMAVTGGKDGSTGAVAGGMVTGGRVGVPEEE